MTTPFELAIVITYICGMQMACSVQISTWSLLHIDVVYSSENIGSASEYFGNHLCDFVFGSISNYKTLFTFHEALTAFVNKFWLSGSRDNAGRKESSGICLL